MITLYHASRSRSSRIVWLLEELGAPHELVHTSIARQDGSGTPDPGNPHPEKRVPALIHDGALITESAAICLYLTDLFPDAGIGPRTSDPLRGSYLTWLAYYAGVIEPVFVTQWADVADKPALVRAWGGKEAVDRRMLAAMHAGPYVLGESFSAVDVLIASMGHWARNMLPPDAIVDEYLARISQRPALARARARDEK